VDKRGTKTAKAHAAGTAIGVHVEVSAACAG